jgi:hypothetical protein
MSDHIFRHPAFDQVEAAPVIELQNNFYGMCREIANGFGNAVP